MADDPDLDAFLKRVDEISGLVDGVSQDKPGASDAADRYLSAHENDGLRLTADRTHITTVTSNAGDELPVKSFVSSTYINPEVGDGESSGAPNNQKAPPASGGNEQSASLAALQADAEERASRRAANRAQAGCSKEEGNACFRAADYVGAEAKYTEALRLWPDGLPLYTNRAQARLRLHDYAGALSDCDWALRLHDRHPKALLRRGLALAGLGRFDDALDSLERARKTLPASGRGEVERHMAATHAARDESARDRAAVMALTALGARERSDGPTEDKADCGPELSPADCAAAQAVLSHLPTLLQAVTARVRLEDDAESDCSRSDDSSGSTSGGNGTSQAKEEATPLAERAMCVSREAAALVRAFRGLGNEPSASTLAAATPVAYDVFRVQWGLTLLPSLAHFLRILGDNNATEAGPGRDSTSDGDVNGAIDRLLEGAAEAAAVCAVLELLRVAAGPNGHAALWEQAGAAAAATHLLKSPHQPVQEAALALLLDSLEAHADTRQTLSVAPSTSPLPDILREMALAETNPPSVRETSFVALCFLSSSNAFCKRYETAFAERWAEPVVAVARKNKDAVGAAALRLLVQMSCDKNMRNVLGKDALAKSLLEVSKERLSELSENTPGVDYALSLLTNVGLAPGASDLLSEASLAESLTVWIMAQSNGGPARTRAVGLLARVCGKSEPAEAAVKASAMKALCSIARLPSNNATSQEELENAVRALAKLCSAIPQAGKAFVAEDGIRLLVDLLDKEIDSVVGNAALTLALLAQEPHTCHAIPEEVIDKLLRHAAEATGGKHDNCAMAVARLARGHAKHLERLRALNGLQILAHRGGR